MLYTYYQEFKKGVVKMLQPKDITEYYINKVIKCGDLAVDATCGNGNDTLKLCRAVGKEGKVFSFDIQGKAIENTAIITEKNGFDNVTLIHDSHSRMSHYVPKGVKAVLFNLGYLPGGDHKLQTKAETTIEAIKQALSLLASDGLCIVTIYYGKNSGTEEKEAVLEFLRNLDYKGYTVMLHDFYNRPNNPPLTAMITPN